ncbi:MAG: carbohydrate kinase family protein [Deltaproteobacteria bacterium]|jgi:adenosine kinase|nr:carbohydrate kinase family protein [Deltaproteobacteria bacterium]
MAIICSGSLAIDRLSRFPGLFQDHILPDKLDFLNICFLVDQVERVPGGTASNIAYNLTLLGEKPLIVGAVGRDSDGQEIMASLKSRGLDLSYVAESDLPTSGCYAGADRHGNQLIFFHPGAMSHPSSFEPKDLPGEPAAHLAIVSPGGFSDMKRLCQAYRDLGIPFIFDPGQQVPAFSGPELLAMLDGALMLIVNEYEIELFLRSTGLKLEDLFQYSDTVVITLGSQGSRLETPRGGQHILPGPVDQVLDPTGAGDAYRAGILKALYRREEILTACRLGSTVASFCVEAKGPQGHQFSPGEVLARHFRTFRETISSLG